MEIRAQLRGFELPESMKPAQEEFDNSVATVLIADRLEGHDSPQKEDLTDSYTRLQNLVPSRNVFSRFLGRLQFLNSVHLPARVLGAPHRAIRLCQQGMRHRIGRIHLLGPLEVHRCADWIFPSQQYLSKQDIGCG